MNVKSFLHFIFSTFEQIIDNSTAFWRNKCNDKFTDTLSKLQFQKESCKIFFVEDGKFSVEREQKFLFCKI